MPKFRALVEVVIENSLDISNAANNVNLWLQHGSYYGGTTITRKVIRIEEVPEPVEKVTT